MPSTNAPANNHGSTDEGTDVRRAATPGPVKAPAPAPAVEIDSTSVPGAGGASTRTKRKRPTAGTSATPGEQAANRARSAGESRAASKPAASATPSAPGHVTAPGPLGASVTLPFVDISVVVPKGAHLHVGPVQVDLGPKTLAVAGAAGVVVAGVVEWPIAVAALGVGFVARRLTWRR